MGRSELKRPGDKAKIPKLSMLHCEKEDGLKTNGMASFLMYC